MHRVSVFGHKPEYIRNKEFVKTKVKRVLEILQFQYNDLIINVVGDIGVNQWVAEECREMSIRYHMFFPSLVEDLAAAWYDEQRESLTQSFKYAWAHSIYSREFNLANERKTHEQSILLSDFAIAFWNGKKQGNTYNNIKFALEESKIVLNGLNDLKLITNEDL